MPEPVIVYTGADEQPLNDQISIGGRPFDLGSATVKFRMREALNDTLKVDADAEIDDAAKGKVHYEWTDLDLDTPGEYFGWWHAVATGGEIDTDEFLIIIAQHAPGLRTRTGEIYRDAGGIIPVTWNALEKDSRYGDSLLQDKIEIAKLNVFGSTIAVEDEGDYDRRVISFIAKVAVCDIIPTGVDYWASQHITVTTQGTQEMVSYPDRIKALWEIYEKLMADIAKEKALVEEILGVSQLRPLIHTPAFSPGKKEGFKTPLSSDFYDYSFPDEKLFW